MKIIIFLTSIIIMSVVLGSFIKPNILEENMASNDEETPTPTPTNMETPTPTPTNKETTKDKETPTDIFYNSNILILFWFLVVYFTLYLILTITQTTAISMSHFFDIVVLGVVGLYFIITYLFISTEEQSNIFKNIGESYLEYLDEPYSIFSMILFILALYLTLFFMVLIENNQSFVISIIKGFAWITLVILMIVDFFKYILGISIISYFKDLISSLDKNTEKKEDNEGEKPVIDISTSEVFHISGNKYTFDDAQAVCSSYGATLANYNQINDYYEKGGEFCNYGWSADQMALFPTQEATWEKIQATKDKKNICGRPGINGGVFDSSYKFGVNCFGIKPSPTQSELSLMSSNIPKTPEEIKLEEKIQYFKENTGSVSSFNKNKWSEWTSGMMANGMMANGMMTSETMASKTINK
jgi:hypothetical protein